MRTQVHLKTKFNFPLHLGLFRLCSGMVMVMLITALKVEEGSSVYCFKEAINGTVSSSCYIVVSSAVFGGSTGHMMAEVSLCFFLAFTIASLFLSYFFL